MSNVIKAHQAIEAAPKTIEQSLQWEVQDEMLNSAAAEDAPTPESAQELLREAESKAKELVATAHQQAEAVLSQAKGQAAGIVAEAEASREQVLAQAQEKGYQAGYAEGKQAIETELAHLRAEAQELVANAHREKTEIIAQAEPELVTLAMAIAEKIIRQEVAMHPELITEIVREALGKVTDREEVIVKVNPADLDYVISIQEKLQAHTQGGSKFKIVSDALISQGGCIVETPGGTIDGRIERQLAEIEETLLEVSS